MDALSRIDDPELRQSGRKGFVGAIGVLLAFMFLFHAVRYWNGTRNARACGDTFRLGDPSALVTQKIASGACADLENVMSEPTPDATSTTWTLRSSEAFADRNWVVRVEVENGAVVAVRYRTQHSANDHPSSAPADLVR